MTDKLSEVARAIANARSSRRTETSRRCGGAPSEMSLAVARLDAKAAIEAIEQTHKLVPLTAKERQQRVIREGIALCESMLFVKAADAALEGK